MPRHFAIAILTLIAVPTLRAADPPERLIAPSTQLYIRWDGITPHKAAYQASALGGVMKGPTGEAITSLLGKLPKQLGAELLSSPLLRGKPLDELKAIQNDVKLIERLPELVLDHGLMLAVEVREPRPTINRIVQSIGGLLGAGEEGIGIPARPEFLVMLVVPDAGARAEALFAPTRIILRQAGENIPSVPLPANLGVTGFFRRADADKSIHLGEWVIDGHFVQYVGSVPVEKVIADMRENAKSGGLTTNPLFQRATKIDGFESVARGFADSGSLLGLVKKLAGPLVPGLRQRLDDTGFGGIKSLVFSSGFDGREARAVWEIDSPGERKGFANILKRAPLALKDLPPLPPDCSRFSALRVNWPAALDGGVTLVEALLFEEQFGIENDKMSEPERIKARREFLARELDKNLSISLKDELLPHLGDVVVAYQSPSEGLQVFGQVFAISCKDPAAVSAAADRIQRAFVAVVGGRTVARKKQYAGVEMRVIDGRDLGIITPSYAVVGNWLVLAGHPQLVQGFILRHKGELESWKPDADTAARFAKFPSDAIGLQYCNPKSTIANLCCIGPTVMSLASNVIGRRSGASEPFDVSLIPNAHELNRHVFPNLVATRDDGKTIRIEVNESFSLPLDCIGFDPFIVALFSAALRF